MRLTFLGTGTSYGVPYLGCECPVCRSDDARNKRLRCSIVVEGNESTTGRSGNTCERDSPVRVLVDTTPDLRQQLLRANINWVSAVLWTHTHNDHVIGLDDIRPLCDHLGYIDGYGSAATIAHLKHVFDYVFVQGREHGGFPRMKDHLIDPLQPFILSDLRITPIPIFHGKREIFAYRFECGARSLVYATDCSGIPDESIEAMRNPDVLVLDALRHKEHPTHFSIDQATAVVNQLKPGRALFTHIAHDLDHEKVNSMLPDGIELAYDTLSFDV